MPQPDDYVPAAAALKMLAPRFSGYSAVLRICERAHAGLVRARAEHYQVGNRTSENFDIQRKFWWAEGNAALTQDWTAGDFSTWIDDVQHKAFGVSFMRADLEKLVPASEGDATPAPDTANQRLYLQLAHLAETAPDFTKATTPDMRLWLGQARTAIKQTDDPTNIAAFEAALVAYSTPNALGRPEEKILQSIYNALAYVGRDVPSAVRGAFIPAGNAHDAVTAVGKILGAAKAPVMLVDPYADAAILDQYALFAPEGVGINILADIKDSKPTLKPAAEAWVRQYGAQRPLSVRLSPWKALHDRLIILDDSVGYIVGQSFNALAVRAPTSINRMDAETARRKIEAHQQFWNTATVLI